MLFFFTKLLSHYHYSKTINNTSELDFFVQKLEEKMNPYRWKVEKKEEKPITFSQKIFSEVAIAPFRILQLACVALFSGFLSGSVREILIAGWTNADAWVCVPLFVSVLGFGFAGYRVKYHSDILDKFFNQKDTI